VHISTEVSNTIVNYGAIIGTSGTGVVLPNDATLVNSGTIRGAGTAVSFNGRDVLLINPGGVLDGALVGAGSSDTIINQGTITASGSAAVNITGTTGVTTLKNSGVIGGESGILVASGSTTTISNSGTIAGTAGTAVSLGGGTNRLILSPGALFQGTVYGGDGHSVLEIEASSVSTLFRSASVVDLGRYKNFSAAQIDSTADVDAS